MLSARASRSSPPENKTLPEQQVEGSADVQDEANYYRRRSQEEIDAAMAAQSSAARKAHLELATRYKELAVAMDQLAASHTA
jgi:hypothetical protein